MECTKTVNLESARKEKNKMFQIYIKVMVTKYVKRPKCAKKLEKKC